MRSSHLHLLLGVLVLLAGSPHPVLAADSPLPTDVAGASVTPEMLQTKIEEVEAATNFEETAKAKLTELYRKALSNLEAASSNHAAAEAFQEAAQRAPAQVKALRDRMEESQTTRPEDTLDVNLDAPLDQIELLLQKEQADQAAVAARHADFEKRLAEQANRPETIRGRLAEATEQQEEVAAEINLPPPADASPALIEAGRWGLEARYSALSSEIRMLDQELLSQPMRVDLLKAERDKAAASVQWIGTRVKILDELVNRTRQVEARQAKVTAEETRRQAEGRHPSLVFIAEQNAVLTEERSAISARLDELDRAQGQAEKLAEQIAEDHKNVQETIEIGGLSQSLGQLLLQQRRSLPDARSYRRKAKAREEQIAESGVRRLRNREEQRRLRDVDQYINELLLQSPGEETPRLREDLADLAEKRKALLAKALDSDEFYLRQLREVDTAQRALLEAAEAYDQFLAKHLLWVRSTRQTEIKQLGALPGEATRFLSPTGWLEVARVLVFQATHSPVFALVILALGALVWNRKRLAAAIRATGEQVGRPATDRFAFTVSAVVLTLLGAATWPLVFVVAGWQLRISLEGTSFTHAVALALFPVAVHFYILRAFRWVCMTSGLASAHFGWPESALHLLRSQIDLLTWILLPTALISLLALNLDPVTAGGVIGRISFLVFAVALTLFNFRVLHPTRGPLADFLRRREKGVLRFTHRILLSIFVAVPLALGLLALAGYLYTAGTLVGHVMKTTWMVGGLIVLDELAVRWLLVVRRRLAYEADLERREAISTRNQTEGLVSTPTQADPAEAEGSDVDLLALSEDGRKLLNTAVVFTGLVGLWAIWADLLPALRILDEVNLWHHTVTVDGEDKRQPITLGDMGLALIYAAGTIVLAKRLPGVLEIIMMHRLGMSAGSRYTVTTLTTYAIVTIGVVVVFNTIGADWSQLQWLVAALGVGIGFGLQEIVANFISGIIILFERPIRVGDVVTVGDTDGAVTKIRIRATTIRNWDGKELLVPNKEFITGRLLNWSLSDQTTRLLVSVGVAYGSDVRRAKFLLNEAAEENEAVLADPLPTVIFESFGDNALTLVLRCFVASVDERFRTISALNEAINDKFNDAGIAIAFPQRDVHLDTNRPLKVSIENGKQDSREKGDG